MQDLPVETTTAQKVTSLTVETTTMTSETNVQEDIASSAADDTGLNVKTSSENNLDTPTESINVVLNVETDLNTKEDGPVTGLNVETSLIDNTK